jgi:hypothetical protein
MLAQSGGKWYNYISASSGVRVIATIKTDQITTEQSEASASELTYKRQQL